MQAGWSTRGKTGVPRRKRGAYLPVARDSPACCRGVVQRPSTRDTPGELFYESGVSRNAGSNPVTPRRLKSLRIVNSFPRWAVSLSSRLETGGQRVLKRYLLVSLRDVSSVLKAGLWQRVRSGLPWPPRRPNASGEPYASGEAGTTGGLASTPEAAGSNPVRPRGRAFTTLFGVRTYCRDLDTSRKTAR